MATLGTIGNVLNASVATRLPYYSFAYGSAWNDGVAAQAVKTDTGTDPISGDTVRIASYMYSMQGAFDETRIFDGASWVAMSSQAFAFPRSAITTSRKGYNAWSDFAAQAAIFDAGKGLPIDGDCVTLYDDTWTQTRYFKGDKWIEESLYFPGVLSAPTAPSKPGLGDEVKPDLLSKKLRSW